MPEKNTVIAIALSAAVLIVFMIIQTTLFPPQTREKAVGGEQGAAVAEPIAAPRNEPKVPSVIPAAETEAIAEQTYTITTKKVAVTFTNRGGDVVSYKLLDHKDGDEGIEMADNVSVSNRAFALSFGRADAIIDELFSAKKSGNDSIVFTKRFAVRNADNTETPFLLAKQYTFIPDDYVFRLDISMTSVADEISLGDSAAYTLRTSPQIGPHYDPKNRYDIRTFMSFNGQKKKKDFVSAGQAKEYDNASRLKRLFSFGKQLELDNAYTWTGIGGKYFALLVVPAKTTQTQGVIYSAQIDAGDYPNAQLFIRRVPMRTKNIADSYHIYVGPLTEKTLKVYNNAESNAWKLSELRLNESLSSSGVLAWLETILKWCMGIIYKGIPNWGASIIVMTFLIKAALYPLTRKSSMSALKMQEIQPKMQEIQARYKDNPQKLNIELSKFYKATGYNPVSGCFPLLIQFPIIIAMYNLFNNYFEFRGSMFIPCWIPDLSIADTVYTFSFWIPFGIGNQLHLLPIIYVASQLLTGKLTQTTGGGENATQKNMMMYGMPLIFFFIFYNAPSGLLIYWTTSNILQLAQQLIINKMVKKQQEARVKANTIPVVIPRKRKK
ncbi:membrane protein insertase YidC [Treponema endosymbiont of Eucomonympha sp.]|uniref:membrane protein insertase YidC n=1 Tax=Treponema endosymbiont of Eucomonympha sp. TaxID=1580831 RepID=UPI000781E94B|nr:membrane protein insertase YidC [Treponema endosymbiont of Eucomonympha sp.]